MMQHPHATTLSIELEARLRNVAALFHFGTEPHELAENRLFADKNRSEFRVTNYRISTYDRSSAGVRRRAPVRGKNNNGNRGSLSGAASCPGLIDCLESENDRRGFQAPGCECVTNRQEAALRYFTASGPITHCGRADATQLGHLGGAA
jgi:hypothetical protein